MLTPAFELTQDDNFLIVSIRVPYVKTSEAEVYFEDYDFKFFCKPYFLKLNLPGKVVSCDEPSVTYDVDPGIMVINIPKATPGEKFEDLNLLTKLLATKTKTYLGTPSIEVIGDANCADEDDFDWEIEQPILEPDSGPLLKEAKCGFANLYSCSIFRLRDEVSEIFDVVDPEKKSSVIRKRERLQAEREKFSDDYYLDNLYCDEEIKQLLAFKPDWEIMFSGASSAAALENYKQNGIFSDEEKELLRRLPNKEYLLNRLEIQSLLFGLIDIIFAYSYNARTTLGENTVESAWTINKISATLSHLESFVSMRDAAKSGMRRSLCYPLFRHWELTKAVLNDTITILSLGQEYVLKCFLQIHQMFNQSDPRFILNDLYITDYCVFVQEKCCQDRTFFSLAEALKKTQIAKREMNLDLEELECGAKIAIKESQESDQLTSQEQVEASSSESSSSGEASSGADSDCLDSSDDRESSSSNDSHDQFVKKSSERQR